MAITSGVADCMASKSFTQFVCLRYLYEDCGMRAARCMNHSRRSARTPLSSCLPNLKREGLWICQLELGTLQSWGTSSWSPACYSS